MTGVLRARADLVASREVALTRQGAEALAEHATPTTWLAYKVKRVFRAQLRGEETRRESGRRARPEPRVGPGGQGRARGCRSDRNPSGRQGRVHATDGRADARAPAACCCRRTPRARERRDGTADGRPAARAGPPGRAPRAPGAVAGRAVAPTVSVDVRAVVAAGGVEGLPTAFEVDVIGDSTTWGRSSRP